MLLSVLGVGWAAYIRTWQLFLWEHCQDAIQESLDEGYTIDLKWWGTEIRCVDSTGNVRIWKGGLLGEHTLTRQEDEL
jgi:hypothetical protein